MSDEKKTGAPISPDGQTVPNYPKCLFCERGHQDGVTTIVPSTKHAPLRAICNECLSLSVSILQNSSRAPVKTAASRTRPLADRLWEKTDRTGGPDACWLWKGAVDQNGRSQIWWDGRVQPGSRAAYFVATGEVMPVGVYACHRCDEPRCVNPAHIFPGTASENQQDAVAKGRNVYGGRGRRLTDEERGRVIESFVGGASLCKLAMQFGVSRRAIRSALDTVGAYPRRTA